MLGRDKVKVAELLKKYDLDNSNDLSDSELSLAKQLIEIEAEKAKEQDRDLKENQLRYMAWVSMISMIAVTIFLFLPILPVDRLLALDNLIQMFYIAQAGVIASFFGSSAYMSRN
jgi:hypothetical protein